MNNAEGTSNYELMRDLCSEGLSTEFKCHAERMKVKIAGLPVSSKKWWKLCNSLMLKKTTSSSIPPLRSTDGIWALTAADKAELLSSAFQMKFSLALNPDGGDQIEEAYGADDFEQGFLLVRSRWTRRILKQLNENSATGPDGLPSMVLKICANELTHPVTKLLRMMLTQGRWPLLWRIHWMLPLYKRKARSSPTKYQGIHLTNQLSKAVERFLGKLFLPRLQALGHYGPRQFAYGQGRSYKDALALCVCDWIWALSHKCRIGLYCSDVAGAFDRVSSERLRSVLSKLHLHESIFKLLCSWLECRSAYVIVDNERSHHFNLKAMVFQGTVLHHYGTFFSRVSVR